MTISGYKRLTIALGLACVALLVLCAFLFEDNRLLNTFVARASHQSLLLDEFGKTAVGGHPIDAANFLDDIVQYHPSGSRLEPGSKLHLIIERQRATTIRSIVAHLRTRTGEDLGDDPKAWIQKYAHR